MVNNMEYGHVNTKTGKIWVNPKVKGEEALDTRLHENLHVKNPKMSEDSIIKRSAKERMIYKAII